MVAGCQALTSFRRIRGIPVKNTPPYKHTPLIDSDFELRGGILIRPPEAEIFQDF